MVTGTDEAIEDPDGDGGVDPGDGNRTMIPGSGQDQGSPDDVKGEECLVGSGNGQIGQLGVWRNAAAESSGPPAQPFQAKGAVDKQEDEGDDAPLEVFLPAKAGQNGACWNSEHRASSRELFSELAGSLPDGILWRADIEFE